MSSPTQPSSRAELIRAWSDSVSVAAEVPMASEEIDEFLGELLGEMIDALGHREFSAKPAEDVGSRLVTRGFTGEQCLGRTMVILGQALLEDHALRTVEGLAGKVVSLLGALA